jgi:hypothetical protein
MKNFTTKLMIAAAVMAVATGAASAQTMKADVPFAFRTVNGTMAAGAYTVSINRESGIVRIYTADGTKSTFLLPVSRIGTGKESEAKLVFSCGTSHCALVQVWSGFDSPAYQFHSPKPDRNDDATQASLVEIRLHRATE